MQAEYDGRRPRLPIALAQAIDEARGQVPFNRWIVMALRSVIGEGVDMDTTISADEVTKLVERAAEAQRARAAVRNKARSVGRRQAEKESRPSAPPQPTGPSPKTTAEALKEVRERHRTARSAKAAVKPIPKKAPSAGKKR